MTSILQNLINSLRDELQQYGEMLALLEHQSEIGCVGGGEGWRIAISAINAQSATIQFSRQTREHWQLELAQAVSLSREADFAQLLPLLPEPYRPLVDALVQENNELLSRVRQRAQENQLLLRRSLEMMQQFLTSLTPTPHTGFVGGEEVNLSAVTAGDFLSEAIA